MAQVKLALLGAGGMGKVIRANFQRNWQCFVDQPRRKGETVLGLPVVPQSDLPLVLAKGDRDERSRLVEKYGITRFYTLQHESCRVHGKLGKACVVMPHAIVQPRTVVGDYNFLHYYTLFGHDTTSGVNCVFNPHCLVSGYCHLGSNVMMGSGSIILPKHTIGDNVTIGAGAIVTHDVPDGATVAGVPARRLR